MAQINVDITCVVCKVPMGFPQSITPWALLACQASFFQLHAHCDKRKAELRQELEEQIRKEMAPPPAPVVELVPAVEEAPAAEENKNADSTPSDGQ